MTTIEGIYENGKIRLSKKIKFKRSKKVLITFLEEKASEDNSLRKLSLSQPDNFLIEYFNDEREDLYQDYAAKNKK